MRPFLMQLSESFGTKAFVRILIASGAITAAIAVCMQLALPNFQFNWVGNFLKAIGAFLAYLAAFLLVYVGLPPFVSIHKKGIQIQHGQGVKLYKHQDILAARLVMNHDGKVWLWWTTEKMSKRVGVSPKVHLVDLQRFFGDKLGITKC